MTTFHSRAIHIIYLSFIAVVWPSDRIGAQPSQIVITESYIDQSIDEILNSIEANYPIKIYYKPDPIFNEPQSISFNNEPINNAIDRLLVNTTYASVAYREYAIVIGSKDFFGKRYTAEYYSSFQSPIVTTPSQEISNSLIRLGNPQGANATGRIELELTVFDSLENKFISGASVLLGDGSIHSTDKQGKVKLNFTIGSHQVLIKYIGYEQRVIDLLLFTDGQAAVALYEEPTTLNEVVISSVSERFLNSPQIGVIDISLDRLEKAPSFMGEVDIIKGLEFIPGVTTVGEGSPGYNVRGGNIDHNLITLDEAMIFNSSHVFGFFGAFNSNIIGSSSFYKGYTPPEFSGRLASALKIKMREGDAHSIKTQGSIGVVSTRATIEGPIVKGRTSFILSGRSSYSDYILGLFRNPELRESSASFYDANANFVHHFANQSTLSISYYRSQDEVFFADRFGFKYATNAVQGKLLYHLSPQLSGETAGVYGTYDAELIDPSLNTASTIENGIDYFKLKQTFNLKLGPSNTVVGGASLVHYLSSPGNLKPDSDISVVQPRVVEEERANDVAAFFSVDKPITDFLSISAGLRFTSFSNRGPQQFFQYVDDANPGLDNVIDTISATGGKIVTYTNFEPRLSVRYKLNPNVAIKAGYSRVVQNLFQVSNTDAITPVDFWKLSDRFIKPQKSHNSSIGAFATVLNKYETSVEVFYRNIDRLVDYRDFADIVANPNLETELISGRGRSYGVETNLKKLTGSLTGTLSYTFSRAQRRTIHENQERVINNGSWYSSNFDKPHSLALAANYAITKRQDLSINFIYSTGRPTTAPQGYFDVDNILNVPIYSDRNGLRIPDYHRLDVAYTISPSHKKKRKWRSSWTFSIYNLYGRRNAYSVFFTQNPLSDLKAQKLSVLGSAFPSITYNFKFNTL